MKGSDEQEAEEVHGRTDDPAGTEIMVNIDSRYSERSGWNFGG